MSRLSQTCLYVGLHAYFLMIAAVRAGNPSQAIELCAKYSYSIDVEIEYGYMNGSCKCQQIVKNLHVSKNTVNLVNKQLLTELNFILNLADNAECTLDENHPCVDVHGSRNRSEDPGQLCQGNCNHRQMATICENKNNTAGQKHSFTFPHGEHSTCVDVSNGEQIPCAVDLVKWIRRKSERLSHKPNGTFKTFGGGAVTMKIAYIDLENPEKIPVSGKSSSKIVIQPKKKGKKIAVISEVKHPHPSHLNEFPIATANLGDDFVKSIGENVSVVFVSIFDLNGDSETGDVYYELDTTEDSIFSDKPPLEKLAFVTDTKWHCVGLDMKSRTWKDDACESLADATSKTAKCKCSEKLSAFTVIFAIREVEIPASLYYIGIVMEVITILFLCITMLILVITRGNMKDYDKLVVQINLCSAILMTHLTFVLAPEAVTHDIGCHVITAMCHFFFTSSAVFMLLSGLLMYVKTSGRRLSEVNVNSRLRCLTISLSWLIPAVYVIICASVAGSLDEYLDVSPLYRHLKVRNQNEPVSTRKYNRCWLGVRSKWIYSAIVPVVAAILINICIILRLCYRIWRLDTRTAKLRPSGAKPSEKGSHTRHAVRAVLVLLPVLGVPWLAGLLVNVHGAEVFFAAVNIFVNGSQGIFIFIIFIYLNRNVRAASIRRWDEFAITHHLPSQLDSRLPDRSKPSGSHGTSGQKHFHTSNVS